MKLNQYEVTLTHRLTGERISYRVNEITQHIAGSRARGISAQLGHAWSATSNCETKTKKIGVCYC